MTWTRDAVQALRKILLIEERLVVLADQVKSLAAGYEDMNRRLARIEGKFELLEHMGAPRRKRLPPA